MRHEPWVSGLMAKRKREREVKEQGNEKGEMIIDGGIVNMADVMG